MLITISGPDGTGKTTQCKLLLKKFKQQGLKIATVSDLMKNFDYQSGKSSDLIKFYAYFKNFDVIHTRFRLHSNENARVMDKLEISPIGNFELATLSAYTAYYDYIQWNKYVNEPLLNEGKILLCDKYAFDDIAFKTTFGCQYEWMKKIYYNVEQPDIGFYMNLDPKVIIERNLTRPDGRIIFYDNIKNVRRLQYNYSRVVQDYNIVVLNGNKSPKEIHNEIITEIANRFPSMFW